MPETMTALPLTARSHHSAVRADPKMNSARHRCIQYLGALCLPALDNVALRKSPAIGITCRNDGVVRAN